MPCYLPSYLCDSMIKPFSELNLNINFFGHEVPLKPLLNKNIENSVILLVDYFGTEYISNKEIEELLNKNNTIIMDLTHSILNKNRFSIKHDNYYIIASLRKIFPIPDGGVVYHSNEKFNSSDKFPENYEPKLEAMLLRYFYLNKMNMGLNVPIEDDEKFHDVLEGIYTKKPEGFKKDLKALKKHYLSLHYEYEFKKQKEEVTPQNIPAISLFILNNISFTSMMNKRNENLKFIYENIKNKDIFLYNLNEIKSPFLLPLIFKSEEERDLIKNALIKSDVYPPILWDIESYVPREFSYEHEFSKRMLTIPIDQRYAPENLQKAVDIINQLDSTEK